MVLAEFQPSSVPTFVVIPVRNRLDLTRRLVDQLAGSRYDALFVLDNGSEDGTWDWLQCQPLAVSVEPVDAVGLGIYAMWNLGIRLARQRAQLCDIAILNNDIQICPHFLDRLSAGLRSKPDLWAVSANYGAQPVEGLRYVRGSFKTGGLAGFAFMARGEIFDRLSFDEGFHWWYGDDDFVAQIESRGGRVGIVGSAAVEHVGGGGQTVRYTRARLGAIERDRRRMWSKWGHF